VGIGRSEAATVVISPQVSQPSEFDNLWIVSKRTHSFQKALGEFDKIEAIHGFSDPDQDPIGFGVGFCLVR